MGTSTPWGRSDSAEHVAQGIVFYSTPSHGGYHVSAGRLAQMPAQWASGVHGYTPGWFEEDCTWSLVVLAFPECFDLRSLEHALPCAERWCEDELAAFSDEMRAWHETQLRAARKIAAEMAS